MSLPIVTVNGIHESAFDTTDAMADELRKRGNDVRKLRYPTRGAFDTRNRLLQYRDAKSMLEQLPPRPVDVVAHSWGCLLTARMMELGGSGIFRNVFLFAPALDPDWIFPVEAFDRMWVIHNRHDRAVWWAKVAFGAWHPLGDMGRVGYQGDADDRITNVEDKTRQGDKWGRLHSHYFQMPHLATWADFVEAKRSNTHHLGSTASSVDSTSADAPTR